MEYRDVEYSVVQTISRSWQWSVRNGTAEKVAGCPNREIGIVRAKKYIDDLIRKREREGEGERN